MASGAKTCFQRWLRMISCDTVSTVLLGLLGVALLLNAYSMIQFFKSKRAFDEALQMMKDEISKLSSESRSS